MLASRYIQNSKIECGFVSTNTVVQGTHLESLWYTLLNNYHLKINFAYNTFKWESEASQKAAVFCVIIGFSLVDKKEKLLFDSFDQNAANGRIVDYISPYLDDKYPYGKPQTDEVARGSGNREYGCRRLREKLPNFSGVSFFRAGNSSNRVNAFHICVYVHLCVVPRYIASQHP